MTPSKLLLERSWKDLAGKHKLKDNGLQKALAQFERAAAGKPDDALRALDDVARLAAQARKARDTGSIAAVQKFLAEMLDAVDAQRREAQKEKQQQEQREKAEQAAKKAEAAKKADDDDEEDESPALLTTRLLPLLRLAAKGETMHALVARAGKQAVVLLARKPIPPARRKLLATQLDGSVRFHAGQCLLEDGALTFVLQAEVAGMSRLLKAALLAQTGMRLAKLKCRGDDGDDADDDGAEAAAPAGDTDDDARDSERIDAASAIWIDTREALSASIAELAAAIEQRCADEAPALRDGLRGRLAPIERIVERLDRRLDAALDAARDAATAPARDAALGQARRLVAGHARYLRDEPLIAHLDRNPFGIDTALASTLGASLAQLDRTLAAGARSTR